jgi:hypothetical protein
MKLFDDIEYQTREDLVNFLQDMDTESALIIMEIAFSYAVKNGAFNLNESHSIFMCLLKLKTENAEKKE